MWRGEGGGVGRGTPLWMLKGFCRIQIADSHFLKGLTPVATGKMNCDRTPLLKSL